MSYDFIEKVFDLPEGSITDHTTMAELRALAIAKFAETEGVEPELVGDAPVIEIQGFLFLDSAMSYDPVDRAIFNSLKDAEIRR